MTLAICFHCGATKMGSYTTCKECQTRPSTENELVKSLCFSDHYLSKEDLKKVGDQIKAGNSIELDNDQVGPITIEVRGFLETPLGKSLTGKREIVISKPWWKFWD